MRGGLAILTLAVAMAPMAGAASSVRAAGAEVKVSRRIATPAAPHGIDFSEDGSAGYVACAGADVIAVLDLSQGVTVGELPGGATPLDALVVEGGGVLATQFRSEALVRVDPSRAETPVMVAKTPAGPSLVTRPTASERRFVVCEFADCVIEIDGRGAIVDSWKTASAPYPAAATSDGALLFVPCQKGDALTIIDALNDEVVRTMRIGEAPEGAAMTPDDATCLVAVSGEDALRFVNTDSLEVELTLREHLGPRPFGVAVSPDGRIALVTNAGGATVAVVDLLARRVAGALEVGAQPIAVRFHPDGRRAYVSCEADDVVCEVTIEPLESGGDRTTEVVVVGTVHGAHLTSDSYGLGALERLIRAARPEVVLAEIPPARTARVIAEHRSMGQTLDERVAQLPEIAQALLPLHRELGFDLRGVSAWTPAMARFRREAIERLSTDEGWAAREARLAVMRDDLAAVAPNDDPRLLHTSAWDSVVERGFEEADGGFVEELGPIGWRAAGARHWRLIELALDRPEVRGKRVLVLFSAAHKGQFLARLALREDVRVIDAGVFLDRMAIVPDLLSEPE